MTKEEAKEYLDNYRKMYAELAPEEFLEALDVMLNEPSLPSTLNKAAEEYAGVSYDCETETDAFYHHIETEAFKAGAEWMAGQGYIKEGIARPDDCEIWVNFTDTNIKDGDEVIVQIRKK